MSTLLARAVAELGLEPGQTYRTTVGDRNIEVRVEDVPAPTPAEPAEEPSPFADMVMLNVFLNIPPSPNAIIVQAVPGDLGPSDPVIIDEWDRTPE